MSKKKVLAGLIFLPIVVAGITFCFMKLDRPPDSGTFAGVPIPANVFSDRIVIEKSSRTMTLYRGTEALKSYRIALGGNPVGHKEFEGDQKTPEGIYSVSGRNPNSSYHLSLRLSYPNAADTLHAQSLGKSPGGDIMIHGLPNGHESAGENHSLIDWTAGCVAVNNAEIEELWRSVPDGTAVEIRP